MSASSSDRGNERAGGGGDAEEEVKTDGWLTTYADMVTLLLTFFVLMVALSNTDTEKMEMFMIALSRNGLSPEEFYLIQEKYSDWMDDLDAWDEEFPFPVTEDEEEGDDEDADQGGNDALRELYDEMNRYIETEGLGDYITLDNFSGDYIRISLANDMLFESGRADITAEMRERMAVISGLIAATFEPNDPFEVEVAGHTDHVPINTAQYPSNWHLSKDRAINVLYELVNNSELDPTLFSSRACGEYQPIASNETPEGRQANRRVEILITLARDNPYRRQSVVLD